MTQIKFLPSFRFTALILFIFLHYQSFAQETPSPMLAMAREEMPAAFKGEAASISLNDKLKSIKDPEPVLKGYVGASYIAKARYSPLFDKKGLLNTGTKILEEAIQEKPNNLELLFLRMTIQTNLPSFLGYNDNIESDKKFILANYESAMPTLKARIVKFIKKSDNFTDEEKATVN